MVTSRAQVVTDRPGRYARQLASHMARKIDAEWDQDAAVGSMTFPSGHGRLRAGDGVLHLGVDGEAEDIEHLETVVGQHLVRFGAKDELVVEWHRDTGEPGTVWRNDDEADVHRG